MKRGKEMANERMVTRKVIANKKVRVFTIENGAIKELEVFETNGRISERELAKKHGVSKVFTDVLETTYKTYGMPVKEFMEFAVEIENEDSEESDEQ